MSNKFKVGDKVSWHWGQGSASGQIKEIHNAKITSKIKGSEITRNGSDEDPALIIEHEDGVVLKLASEVSKN